MLLWERTASPSPQVLDAVTQQSVRGPAASWEGSERQGPKRSRTWKRGGHAGIKGVAPGGHQSPLRGSTGSARCVKARSPRRYVTQACPHQACTLPLLTSDTFYFSLYSSRVFCFQSVELTELHARQRRLAPQLFCWFACGGRSGPVLAAGRTQVRTSLLGLCKLPTPVGAGEPEVKEPRASSASHFSFAP